MVTIEKKIYIEENLSSCKKPLFVECTYSKEFKKWVPQTVSTQDKLSRMNEVQRYETK